MLWSAGSVEYSALSLPGANPHPVRLRDYNVLLPHERWHQSVTFGIFEVYWAECDKYDSVLIQVVDVIAPDDDNATRRAKFHLFYGWANVAMIGATKHYTSSDDEQH